PGRHQHPGRGGHAVRMRTAGPRRVREGVMRYDCQAIAKQRFTLGTLRSELYRVGFIHALESRLNNQPRPSLVLRQGSVEFDAYFSGWDAGCLHALALLDRWEA